MSGLTGARRTERRRVLFVDTDAGGRIHFTAALRWAEAVEHRLVRDLDPGCDIGTWPRRRVEATYHRALGFDDEFDLTLGVVRVGSTSVTWAWQVERDGAVWVEGGYTTVHVGADGAPEPVPAALRAALSDPTA
ncbi:tol-pal system-associated acyl-CoA thioesterase [Rhodococcus aerolatus]